VKFIATRLYEKKKVEAFKNAKSNYFVHIHSYAN
jgi:hypothetical protein